MAQVPDTNNYKMLSQQRQEKPESRGPKAPEKQHKTLYLEADLYWLLSRSPEQERERTPIPKHKRGTNQKARCCPSLGGRG